MPALGLKGVSSTELITRVDVVDRGTDDDLSVAAVRCLLVATMQQTASSTITMHEMVMPTIAPTGRLEQRFAFQVHLLEDGHDDEPDDEPDTQRPVDPHQPHVVDWVQVEQL